MKLVYTLGTIFALPVMLPIMALLWIVNKAVVPFRKSSSNGMVFIEEEGVKTLYSPYFEFETYFLESKLLVKVVIKLGNDGINAKMHAPQTQKAQKVNIRKLLFREATLFLINQDTTPIEIAPKYLEIDSESITKYDDTKQLIAAGHYYECEPAMAKDVRDVTSYDLKVIVEFEDQMHEVVGTAHRMSVAALTEKYHKANEHETK